MGLHRLTPVMTSAQRHNKANSRLLQVQLLGLPGGEQKTPKKHRHVVGGDSRVPPELLRAGRHANQQLHNPILAAPSPGAGDSGAFGVAHPQRAGEGEAQPHAPPLPPLCPFNTKPKQNAPRGQPRHFLLQLQGPCLAQSLPAHPASHQSILELAPGTLQEGSSGDQKAPRALLQKLFYSDLLPAPAKPQIFLQRGRGLLLRRCHLQVGREEPCMQQGSSSPSSTPQPAALGRATKNCAFKVPSAQG